MKRLLVIHLFLLFPFFLYGQGAKNKYGMQNKVTVVDTAMLECIYYYLASDPVLNESRESPMMLQIGKQLSKYMDYGRFQQDSTFNYYNVEEMTFQEYMNLARKFVSEPTYIIKDMVGGGLEFHGHVFMDYYIYEESKPAFGWTLTDDTLTVCGRPCHGATATFRGREWRAWYADEIPLSNGPWKFSGLPGLILKIEDSTREHVFTAVSIRKGASDITQVDHQDFKTNRVWFNNALKEYRMNPHGAVEASGIEVREIGGNGAPPRPRRLFHNPIEKE